jgi:PAS domain S-box-containing protein
MLFSAGRRDYPNLHTILDTTASLLSGILSFLLWDLGVRNKQRFLQLGAVSFAVTAVLELVHAMVTVEWTGPLAPIRDNHLALRPSTWAPAAFILPVGLLGALWLARRRFGSAVWFALGLVGLNTVLLLVFYKLPRYSAPGWLGISRPTLVLVPVLWGVAAWRFWKARKAERLMAAFALMSAPLLLGHIAILYSQAPHDTPAMVAHLGKTAGYLILLLSTMRLASIDMFQRIRTEADLTLLNQELEKRVNDRTVDLDAANDALSTEVSVRRVAEQEAREGQRKMAGIIDSAMDAVITVDSAQRILVFNRAAEVMFLCPAAEALGGSLDRFLPERFRAVHSSHIHAFGDTGVSSRAMARSREIFGLRSDGTEFPLEASISQVEAGGQKLFTVIMRDVTERHHAEARFRQVIEHAPNGMVMVDNRGRISLVNAQVETSFGYSRDELIGQPIEILVPQRFRPEHPALRDGFIAQPTHRSMGTGRDLFGLRKDGTEFPVEIGLNPIETETGMTVLGTIVDITERKAAEKALRESEDQFRTMANSIPQLSWMAHPDGSVFWYNQRWHDYTGTNPEQMEGWGWQSVHDPQVLPLVMERWRAAIATGQPLEMEFPLRRADGQFRQFLTRVQPVKNSSGEVVQWFGTNTDVDDLKQMEASLRETQSRLHSTMAAGSIGTWTWDIVNDSLVADEYIARMFSLDAAAAAQGLPVAAYLAALFEDDQRLVSAALNRAIETCGQYDVEYRVRQQDGELFWLQAKGRVDCDAAGQALSFHGAVIDIDDRKQAEAERRTSDERYRALFDYAPDGIVIADANSYYLDGNASICQMLGYTRDEFIGMHASDIVAPDELPHIGVALGVIKTESEYEREWRFRRRDGSTFPADVIATLMPDGNLLGVIRDITERKTAEMASQRLVAIVDSSDDAIIGKDLAGIVTSWNRGAEQIFGYTAAEMVGTSILQLIPDELQSEEQHFMARIRGGERIEQFETVRRTKDGRVIDISITLSPIVDATGRIIGVSKVAHDITTRKRTEDALKESEARLRIVTENARVGLVMVNAERRYTFANNAYAEILGLPSADIVGQRVVDVLPQLYETQVRPRLDLAFAGERVTYELNRPDGGGERSYAVSYEPMLVANAETMVVVVITEITERKQAVIALQESKAELETIVENLDEGIAVSDLRGNLVHFNRAALDMHGFRDLAECRRHLHEFIGTFELSTLNGQVISPDEWPLARVLRGEKLNNVEIAFRSLRDGWQRIFAYGGTLVHDTADKPMLAVVTIRDITEAKKAESEIIQLNETLERRVRDRTAELEAVNKELEAFSYSVSHDLRAPLRHINGFSLALLEDYGDQLDTEGKGFLQEVRAASQEMAQLIDDVLQLARVTRAEMVREEIDLSALAEKTVMTLRERDPGREVAVTIAPGLVVRGDKRLLEITLVNLFGNAWKFTSKAEHPQIALTGELIDGERVFCVRDNGAGFDQTFSDKLFRAFQRLHTGAEFEGTGIGLATVQRIVNRHGGRVWAQGKVGGGASFFFTITER